MKNDNNILNGLIDIGFSERQAKVYLVLYKKPDANLANLQKLTGIRQDKLGEVLNNLITEGYCSEKKTGRKRFFNVTNPKTSITNAIKKMEKRLKDSYELEGNLEEMYQHVDVNKEPFEYTEVFHGNDNIHYHYCELVKNSKNEILSFVREPFSFHTPEQKKEQEDVIYDFFNRNGKARSICEKEFIMKHPNAFVEPENDTGEDKIRITDSLPLKMFVFDNKTLFIADTAPLNISNELKVVLFKQQTIVGAFTELFNFFWQKSKNVRDWKEENKEITEN